MRISPQDWWNATSFATYYRKWNIVVHDWLHLYIYQDLFWVRGPGWQWGREGGHCPEPSP